MIRFGIIFSLLILAGCTTAKRQTEYALSKDSAPLEIPENISAIPDAIPRFEPRTNAGNPKSYSVLGKTYKVLNSSKGYVKRGIASWYGRKFHGYKTSNGETYDMFAMTAAHKTLPIPTYLRVTNLKNNRSIVVRVNDRGPFHENRIIDLSYVAAMKLGITKKGTGFVEIKALEPNDQTTVNKPPTFENEIYLQIGAFNNPVNARELKNRLNRYHLPNAIIKTFKKQKETWYKVQYGPLLSMDDADDLSQKLSAIGINQTQYISENRSN